MRAALQRLSRRRRLPSRRCACSRSACSSARLRPRARRSTAGDSLPASDVGRGLWPKCARMRPARTRAAACWPCARKRSTTRDARRRAPRVAAGAGSLSGRPRAAHAHRGAFDGAARTSMSFRSRSSSSASTSITWPRCARRAARRIPTRCTRRCWPSRPAPTTSRCTCAKTAATSRIATCTRCGRCCRRA